MTDYDLFEHRHRFSVWAAARAVQRRFKANIGTLREAIENSGVVSFSKNRAGESLSNREFDDLHRKWCNSIITFLTGKGVQDITYGPAAKLIAIYLKSMVILGAGSNTDVARVAHPPIDQILLKNISRSPEITSEYKGRWRQITWTQLDETAYYRLIGELKQTLPADQPFWTLERFWTVTDK